MVNDIEKIRNVVGDITQEQLKYVDCFVSENLCLFIPSEGPCDYSIMEDHCHPGYSFILYRDDMSKVSFKGKIIDSISGKFCSISPGIVHHEILIGKFSRYTAIMISRSFFESQLALYTDDGLKSYEGDFFDSSNELKIYLKDFMIEYKSNLPASEILLEALALRITHEIIRTAYGIKNHAVEKINMRMGIDKAIEYMHSKYENKISVEELAKMAFVSSSHFNRLFKKETGTSPMEYLSHIRIEKSKKLLLIGEKTVTEIAYETGFSGSSHFATVFSQKTGFTPSDYKKNFK